MKNIIVIMIVGLIVLISISNVNADQQIVMDIEGMTCNLGPLAIKKSLSETEGVKDVKVSYKEGKAWITVTESIGDQVLIDAVSKAGPYKGKVIERKSLN